MNIEKHRAFIDSLSPDLKEKVKAFGRDAMDAVETYRDAKWGGEHLDERERKAYKAFRSLCAPDRGGEVKQ